MITGYKIRTAAICIVGWILMNKRTENLLICKGKNSARGTVVTKQDSHKSCPGENHY